MADTYLERLHAQRDALMAAIDEAVPGAATASYSLSDSDGTQSETRRRARFRRRGRKAAGPGGSTARSGPGTFQPLAVPDD